MKGLSDEYVKDWQEKKGKGIQWVMSGWCQPFEGCPKRTSSSNQIKRIQRWRSLIPYQDDKVKGFRESHHQAQGY